MSLMHTLKASATPTEFTPCYDVNIIWDDEACVWVALADDIPLALESDSFDLLIERVKVAAPEILELNFKPCTSFCLRFSSERLIISG